MRLAVVASHPIQYQAPLFRELARRFDLHVFYAHRATPRQQAEAGFGQTFDWDIDLESGYLSSFLRNVAGTPSVERFLGCDTPEISERLRAGRFDVVLIFGWHLKAYLQALFAAKRLGLRTLARGDSHLDTPRSKLKRVAKVFAYPPFLRLFDAALYVGRRSRAYYERYFFPADRLFFSPHCVDVAWFKGRATSEARALLRARLGVARGTALLLFAGKLIPRKRPLDLVAAASRCREQGAPVEVLIAGSGELNEALAREARSLSVPLHRLGFCNQSEMPAAYAAADVLVQPSTIETWGLVANEALACGRPIIVSAACGCAPDLAADGAVGRTFPAGDVAALSRAILDLLRAPPTPEALAAMSERYSVSAAADGIAAATRYVTRDARGGVALR